MAPLSISRDAFIRGLVDAGFSRDVAERRYLEETGERAISLAGRTATRGVIASLVAAPAGLATPVVGVLRPTAARDEDALVAGETLRLRLPWSVLVSDNARHVAQRRDGETVARLRTAPGYAAAKKTIARLARDVVGERAPVAAPVALVARVYVPDTRPHDVANFAKLVHDALEGIVYVNDRWLYDVRWTRAGVDVDAPRAEVTLSLLPAPV